MQSLRRALCRASAELRAEPPQASCRAFVRRASVHRAVKADFIFAHPIGKKLRYYIKDGKREGSCNKYL